MFSSTYLKIDLMQKTQEFYDFRQLEHLIYRWQKTSPNIQTDQNFPSNSRNRGTSTRNYIVEKTYQNKKTQRRKHDARWQNIRDEEFQRFFLFRLGKASWIKSQELSKNYERSCGSENVFHLEFSAVKTDLMVISCTRINLIR